MAPWSSGLKVKYLALVLMRFRQFEIDRICVTDFSVAQKMLIQAFAKHEKHNGPLNAVLHARFPEPIVSFVKTTALIEGVSESTVLRFALEQWATAQGFSEHCS